MTDPFTSAFNTIWDVLLEDSDFANSVKPGNRIGGDQKGASRRQIHRTPADFLELGEVRIVPVPGGQINLNASSSSTRITQNFAVEMATSSPGFVDRLFPLKFVTIRAFARAISAHGATLGNEVITRATITDTLEGNESSPINRESSNWFGLLTIIVDMQIKTTTFTE